MTKAAKKEKPVTLKVTGLRPNGIRGYQPKPSTKTKERADYFV